MIDIITDSNKNLKNIRQIGKPTENDRIYIEDKAYGRLHQEDFSEKRVFVFMGHTEKQAGGYITFVEATIPVYDIEFEQNVPIWNNRIWNEVFREIKRLYENAVIVGWAIDLKGIEPKATPELEAVHREQFGGVHQIFMIMDSLEQEEYFYQNRNNHLYQKEGFYIYYENTAREKKQDMELEIDIPFEKRFREKSNDTKIDLRKNIWIEKEERNTYVGREETPERINRGKYRELLKQQPAKSSGKKVGAYGMAAVVVLLIGIVGTGIYQERIKVSGLEQMIETIAGAVSKSDTQTTEKMETEQVSTEETLQQIQSMETMSDEIIPVENIPGGDIIQDTSAEVHTEAALETIEETPVEVQMMEQQQQMSDIQVEEEVQVVSDPQSYTVQKGDTLIKICQKIYGNTNRLNDIATLNEMENPDNLREGQQIVLPQ